MSDETGCPSTKARCHCDKDFAHDGFHKCSCSQVWGVFHKEDEDEDS